MIPGNPNPLQTIDDEFVSVGAQLQEVCLTENSDVLKVISCKESEIREGKVEG